MYPCSRTLKLVGASLGLSSLGNKTIDAWFLRPNRAPPKLNEQQLRGRVENVRRRFVANRILSVKNSCSQIDRINPGTTPPIALRISAPVRGLLRLRRTNSSLIFASSSVITGALVKRG